MMAEFPAVLSGSNRRSLANRLRTVRCRKGWDSKELAERARISRTTLHHLERGETRNPRGSTIKRLADALDVSVEELCFDSSGEEAGLPCYELADMSSRFDRETNPAVSEVVCTSPGLFRNWTREDWDELYSTFGTGGALNSRGVVARAEQINRRRETVRQLQIVLETHLSDVAEQMVKTLYEMVQLKGVPAMSDDTTSLLQEEMGHSVADDGR